VCRRNVDSLNKAPAKHVDVCVDSDEDRGSIPLASTFSPAAKKCHAVALAEANCSKCRVPHALMSGKLAMCNFLAGLENKASHRSSAVL
jgi:hypothetical protein